MNLKNNLYLRAWGNIYALLNKNQHRKLLFMILLLLFNAILDVFGLAAIFPLVAVMLDNQLIFENVVLERIYNLFTFESPQHFLLFLSFILFLIYVVKNAIGIWIHYREGKISFDISHYLSGRQYKYYYSKGFLYINQDTSGKIIYNIINVPYLFARNYILPVLVITTEIVVLFAISVGMILYNPVLVLVLGLVMVPAFLLLFGMIKNKARRLGEMQHELSPKVMNSVFESMKGFSDVTLANKENFFLNAYLGLQDKINRVYTWQSVFNRIPAKAGETIIVLGIMVIFGFSLIFKTQQANLLLILSLFAGAAYRMIPSINRIVSNMLNIKRAFFTYDVLKDLLNHEPYEFETVRRMEFNHSLKLSNINFTYPTASLPTLKNISMEIQKGETIGIVGESGSGKTTLLKILLRFLTEDNGQFLVDGKPLSTETNPSFQVILSYVKQDVFIKDASVKENIAFGEESANISKESVWMALKQVMLQQFIKEKKEDLEFPLGEEGSKLSGGQKQRIGIARALYKNSDIMILDEATSALDSETEGMITDVVKELSQLGKTTILVAHRITTLKHCDRIYELKHGEVARICSYEELISENIDYATS